jgi:hypothetical protein
MATYEVEVQRTIYTSVEVEADSAEEAESKVESVTFPLPPRSEWEALDDETIIVRDGTGEELSEASR